MSLRRRIEALEAEAGGAEPCEECGGGHGDGVPVGYEVLWEDMPGPSDIDDLGPDYCPECGRQLVFTVMWGD